MPRHYRPPLKTGPATDAVIERRIRSALRFLPMFPDELTEHVVRHPDEASVLEAVLARMLKSGDLYVEDAGSDRWLQLRDA